MCRSSCTRRSCPDRTSSTASCWSARWSRSRPPTSTLLRVIGFIGVVLAAGNAVGGYVVTERMLKMFVTARAEKRNPSACPPSRLHMLTQLSYLVGGRAVHPRPEAHELAGHRGSGVRWAGAGMLLATLATLAFIGCIAVQPHAGDRRDRGRRRVAWVSGKRVAMTDMPQMIALYNGMGGGAAAAIAAVELYGGSEHEPRASRDRRRRRLHRLRLLQRQPHCVRQTPGPDHEVAALRRPENRESADPAGRRSYSASWSSAAYDGGPAGRHRCSSCARCCSASP